MNVSKEEIVLFNNKLIAFLNNAPTPFHAVKEMSQVLCEQGFTALNEADVWNIGQGGKYFVTRNDSSLIAFSLGKGDFDISDGMRCIGAHTDSPSLKLKSVALIREGGTLKLGVEVYGGIIPESWFDRELSLAGRVVCEDMDGSIVSILVDFKRPIGIIPSLAIHLRQKDKPPTINPQKELVPIVGLAGADENLSDINEVLLAHIKAEHVKANIKQVLEHELFLYDVRPAGMFGFNNEFIAGARIDNLTSCFAGLKAIEYADGDKPFIAFFASNEETGSLSYSGAGGTFFNDVLIRLFPEAEDNIRLRASSMLVSMDNAHAAHPNYPETVEPMHAVKLNAGPAIKVNANERYATTSITGAAFRLLAQQSGMPVQTFVMPSNMSSGTTIGPIIAAGAGIPAVDVGIPSLGMHSTRETIGAEDGFALFRIICAFLKNDICIKTRGVI